MAIACCYRASLNFLWVLGQSCGHSPCCREDLQVEFTQLSSGLVQGAQKMCSCLPCVLCGTECRGGTYWDTTQEGYWPPTGSHPGWLHRVVCLLQKGQKRKNKIVLTACDVAQMDLLLKIATCCIEVAVSWGQSWAPPPLEKSALCSRGLHFYFCRCYNRNMKYIYRGESSSFMIIMLVSGLQIPYNCEEDFVLYSLMKKNGIFTEPCRLGMDCSEINSIFLTC